jgi:outer membrane translocation and assembly module TamA
VHLLRWGKAVEFAEKARAISRGQFGEVGDEGLDQIPAGLTEFLGATEISGITLDQAGIKLMLADQQTESITQPRLAIA